MSDSVERHEFQAEVKQLLDLMVHSLYSGKDIFLRELVSNASDALDKLRFAQLTQPELKTDDAELAISLSIDEAARTLTISDNGIGMTRDEVVKNIGTIAKSGTKEFLAKLKESNKPETGSGFAGSSTNNPGGLIGQFGVGFYSAFMVADRVELVTRKAGSDTAVRWISTGDGSYTIEPAERAHAGTTITLHLKAVDEDEGLHDYAQAGVLREIVKRYSDFVAYPVKLGDETLNSQKAIWDRPKSEVTEQEYKDFYHHISHDWTDPLRTIPVRMEGTIEAYSLLYIPSRAPMDLYSPEMKRGLQLYVKRVFVMDECKDLLPSHLRFVRGVVDAHDLSLNVSREILQKDRQIQIIRKQLVKKVLQTLEEMKADAHDDYLKFWAELGAVLKEGLVNWDATDKEKILDLVLAPSTKGTDLVSLDQYVARMKEGQDAIYFLAGASAETIAKSPLLEAFKAKDVEVLLFSDAIDELWLERAPAFKDKKLQSIAKGDIDLGDAAEKTEQREEQQKEYGDLLAALRVALQEDVKEVRLSQRLTSSVACLVGDENDLSPSMARMLEQMGQKPPKTKRVLELNPQHPLLGKLAAIFAESKSDPRLDLYAKLLYGQAQLAETGSLADSLGFSQALGDLMLRAAT